MILLVALVVGAILYKRKTGRIPLPEIATSFSLSTEYDCRVCGFSNTYSLLGGMLLPPGDEGKLCACCGAEAGLDDADLESAMEYRKTWLECGGLFEDKKKQPGGWKLVEQFRRLPSEYLGDRTPDEVLREFLPYRKFVTLSGNRLFVLEGNYPELGVYLYVLEGGHSTHESLHNSFEIGRQQALDVLGIPVEAWHSVDYLDERYRFWR